MNRLCSFVSSLPRTNLVLSRVRNFSSEIVPATKPGASSIEAASPGATTTTTPSLEGVVRHGAGDGVICLDVGGKHFYTLRSTVAANPVLADIVARAEANAELTSSGNAVFVDRDPKHFQHILTYLRNKSEDLSFSQKASLKKGRQHVQLPKDKSQLADLYVEATYFELADLKDALCHHSIFTWAASAASGSKGNPFHAVSDMVKILRRVAVGLAGFGTVSLTTIATDLNLPWAPKDDGDQTEKEQPPKNPAPT